MPDNPFVISLLAAGARFFDREDEVARITAAFRTGGGKLVVYGDRRLGKSSALERSAELVRGGREVRAGRLVKAKKGRVAIASFATASDASEAAQRVLSAAQAAIGSGWRDVMEGVARSLSTGLEITPSVDPTGMPAVRFRLGTEVESRRNDLLPDVLDGLNTQLGSRGMILGLGLDEFQRLHEWGGEAAEWAFREAVQRHDNIAYVLAGSRKHLIQAMVGMKGRALWKLADVLHFHPVDPAGLSKWIVDQASATGIDIPREEAGAVVRLAGPRTRDIVQLARALWAASRSSGKATPGSAAASFDQIVDESAELYRSIFARLNARQQGVLRAFAASEVVQITSAAVTREFRLGPKSSVQSTVDTLLNEEHLTRREDGGYEFDDPYFRRWVQRVALPDIGLAPPPLTDVAG